MVLKPDQDLSNRETGYRKHRESQLPIDFTICASSPNWMNSIQIKSEIFLKSKWCGALVKYPLLLQLFLLLGILRSVLFPRQTTYVVMTPSIVDTYFQKINNKYLPIKIIISPINTNYWRADHTWILPDGWKSGCLKISIEDQLHRYDDSAIILVMDAAVALVLNHFYCSIPILL